jgi:uncharacterized membrane protein YgdD (TMEM256/DUF423 family)
MSTTGNGDAGAGLAAGVTPRTANAALWVRLAAASGLISVATGAFATHSMAGHPAAQELLHTGAQYEGVHALAALAAVALRRGTGRSPALVAPALFLGGSVLFSGSLYALAFGAPRLVGAITPLGGLSFMAGWAWLIWNGGRGRA